MSEIAEIIEFRGNRTLICPECHAKAQAGCDCGVSYVPAGELARRAIEADPTRSNRAIAEELSISNQTVMRARQAAAPNGAPEKTTGRDGKNYPAQSKRGKKAEKTERARQAVRPMIEAGLPIDREKIAESVNVGPNAIQMAVAFEKGRLEGLAEINPIARVDMAPTMAQRYEAALRKARAEIRAELEAVVRQEVYAEWQQKIDDYRERVEQSDRILNNHRGFIYRDEYLMILACLHPDHNKFAKATEAFHFFKGLENILVKLDPRPNAPPLPKTIAELMAKRRRGSPAPAPAHPR